MIQRIRFDQHPGNGISQVSHQSTPASTATQTAHNNPASQASQPGKQANRASQQGTTRQPARKRNQPSKPAEPTSQQGTTRQPARKGNQPHDSQERQPASRAKTQPDRNNPASPPSQPVPIVHEGNARSLSAINGTSSLNSLIGVLSESSRSSKAHDTTAQREPAIKQFRTAKLNVPSAREVSASNCS